MSEINLIDTKTIEGRLLFAAIAKITTESQRDKTPSDVLQQTCELADKMFAGLENSLTTGLTQEEQDFLFGKWAEPLEDQKSVKEQVDEFIQLLDTLLETPDIYTDQQRECMKAAQDWLLHAFGRVDINHEA